MITSISLQLDCDDVGARRWKAMDEHAKAPWMSMGKLNREQYAKAKDRLDKTRAQVSKTAATVAPKKPADAQGNAMAKCRIVSKVNLVPLPASMLATPTAGKVQLVAMMQEVPAAPKSGQGSVAMVTAATKKTPTAALTAKQSVKQVCFCFLIR